MVIKLPRQRTSAALLRTVVVVQVAVTEGQAITLTVTPDRCCDTDMIIRPGSAETGTKNVFESGPAGEVFWEETTCSSCNAISLVLGYIHFKSVPVSLGNRLK